MAIAKVGSVASANSGTAAVALLDVTIAPTAGNTVVVWVAYRTTTASFTSVTATGGTATFVQRLTQANTSSTTLVGLTASNVGAGITKVTVNLTSSIIQMACAIEYSGVDNTTPMDVTATTAQAASATAQSSASITPSTSGALVLAGLADNANSGTTTPFKATTAGPTTHAATQAGTGWTSEHDRWNQGATNTSINLVVASNGFSGAGAYQCDWTTAVAGATGLGSIVLRPAGGAAVNTGQFFQMF